MADVSVDSARELIRDGAIVIDVRTKDEYDSGHIEGAINIDCSSSAFRDRVSRLLRDEKYVVYCKTGGRSAAAVKVLEGLGFLHVFNMAGGISRWIEKGMPVSK